jgi:hypothetical protein
LKAKKKNQKNEKKRKSIGNSECRELPISTSYDAIDMSYSPFIYYFYTTALFGSGETPKNKLLRSLKLIYAMWSSK